VSSSTRRLAVRAVLAATLSFGASELPAWRLDPSPPPAATLLVGEPTPWIFRNRTPAYTGDLR
jgi:hypothetical protein